MTEYDYSPEAATRYHNKLKSVGRWCDDIDSVRTGSGLRDPYTPATPMMINDSLDVTRERLSRRSSSRHGSDRPKTAPPRGDVYGQYHSNAPQHYAVPPPQLHIPQAGYSYAPQQQGYSRYVSPPAAPSPLSPNYYNNYHQYAPQGIAAHHPAYPVARPIPVKSSSYNIEPNHQMIPVHPQPKRSSTLPAPAPNKPVIPPFVPLTAEDLTSSSSLNTSYASGSSSSFSLPSPISPVSPGNGKKSGRANSPLLKRVFGGIFGGSGHSRSSSLSAASSNSMNTVTQPLSAPAAGSKHTRGFVLVDEHSPDSRIRSSDRDRDREHHSSSSRDSRDRDSRGRHRDADDDRGHRRSKSTHHHHNSGHKSSRHRRDESRSSSRDRKDRERDHRHREKPKRRERRNSTF